MAYVSRSNRAAEFANKANHSHIINDSDVADFLANCELPKEGDDIKLLEDGILVDFVEPTKNPIKYVITVDGGYTEVDVKKSYPSSKIAFFQFGAFLLSLEDWQNLDNQPFISPEDMAKFNDLERIKLVLPTKLVSIKGEANFTSSVRKTIYDFFMKLRDNTTYMETLKWFVFEEYNATSNISDYEITNPIHGKEKNITLLKPKMNKDFTFTIDGDTIYLTDIFRLHEKIDDELGAGGILGNIATLIEQLIIVHHIKYLMKTKVQLLDEILFIKDGSLAFFDVTARLHTSMRRLINYLHQKHNLYLVGLEKTGPFADHAQEISRVFEIEGKEESRLEGNRILILSNNYIYKYITPGDPSKMLYGDRSYYSSKVIFKSKTGGVYVTNFPTKDKKVVINPQKSDFKNIDIILHNLSKLKCEMYDNSLVPVTLANKLVSLSNHPSQDILEKFARNNVKK